MRDCIRYKRMGRGKGKGWSIPRCYRWLEDAEEKEDVGVEAKRRILKPILARGEGREEGGFGVVVPNTTSSQHPPLPECLPQTSNQTCPPSSLPINLPILDQLMPEECWPVQQ